MKHFFESILDIFITSLKYASTDYCIDGMLP